MGSNTYRIGNCAMDNATSILTLQILKTIIIQLILAFISYKSSLKICETIYRLCVLNKTKNLLIWLSSPASNFVSHSKRLCSVIAWSEGNANTWPPECRFTTTRRGRGGRASKYVCKIPLPTGVFFLWKGILNVLINISLYNKIMKTVYRTLTFKYSIMPVSVFYEDILKFMRSITVLLVLSLKKFVLTQGTVFLPGE